MWAVRPRLGQRLNTVFVGALSPDRPAQPLSLTPTPARPLSGASSTGTQLFLWLSQRVETHSMKERSRGCHTCARSLGLQASSVQVPLYPGFLLPFPPHPCTPAPLHPRVRSISFQSTQ